jgi:hypothetical protein
VPALQAATVTTIVEVALAQPPEPDTVYVIVTDPAATPVTKPEALTVAMFTSLEVQLPPAVPLEVI